MSDFTGPGAFGASPFDDFLARFLGGGQPRRSVYRVDITRLLSDQARELLATALRRLSEWGRNDVDTDHLLWAATKTEPTRELLRRAGTDPDQLASAIEQNTQRGEQRDTTPSLTPAAKRTLLDAHQISSALGSSYIGPEHLLLALAAHPESAAGRYLSEQRITPETLQEAAGGGGGQRAEPAKQTSTPTLDQYGRDLSELSRRGQLDPVVGRDEEIEQTIEVLSRRTKNNPVLIGEAGVGKTAIVEGIAQRIDSGDVPGVLSGRRVVQLDLTGMVAGTRYRGDFEERMQKVLEEIRAHHDQLIIFIDELHTVVTAGGAEGAAGAGNILKPALARGELHIVGATTLDEYRRNIETDPAFERRFQPILVPEPTVPESVAILHGLRDRYEAHHQVRFTDGALQAAVELSDRYLTDRYLPDKAIDLVDQTGARVRLRAGAPKSDVQELERRVEQLARDKDQAVAEEQYEQASEIRDQIADVRRQIDEQRRGGQSQEAPHVRTEDVAEVVARITGIPVSQLTEEERTRLLNLEEQLRNRVIGQDEAVHAVAEAVRRSRAGLSDPARPIGSFLFLGQTGVGKTELARALAEAMFGSEDRMVRLDMSEFQERHTASRLVGAPPGYVGYEEAGQLTEAVRRRPYSVILLDEVEKAHQEVFNILLQVLDDGRLTDSQGRTVDFKNTILIMTSNLGSELLTGAGPLGFATSTDEEEQSRRDRVLRRLRETFRPEFLNRIDEIVVFRQLTRDELRRITDLLLEETRRRAHAQDIEVEVTPSAMDWLTEQGYERELGARPMRRTIQRELDNELSRMMLEGQLSSGATVTVDKQDGQLSFRILESSNP